MGNTNWKDIVELIGIAAIVASLIFVGIQMRQEQDIAIVDSYGSVVESTTNLADLVERNADIWKRGLDGEELSSTDKIKFLALVTAIEIHFSASHIRWNLVGPVFPDAAARGYAHALYSYPGLRNARADQIRGQEARRKPLGGFFASRMFQEAADRYLKEFDELAPPIPSERTYVFW